MSKTSFIEKKRFMHLLKIAEESRGFPVRNVAVLTTIYGTGMMVTELARIPVKAYLRSDGSILVQSAVAADIAYNRTARPLYWSNKKVTAAIDKYLEYRIEHKHCASTRMSQYRGLDPESPLFLTDNGKRYELTARTTQNGKISYASDSLSQLFRKLHLQAGIKGASAMSARRTFAMVLYKKGYSLEQIKTLLGLTTLKATKALIDAEPVHLGNIVAKVL